MCNAKISIHATRRGRDQFIVRLSPILLISIHATRRGRDKGDPGETGATGHFNSRDPQGPRCGHIRISKRPVEISIHATRRGRDIENLGYLRYKLISIHATRRGRDPTPDNEKGLLDDFNSRDPQGPRYVRRNADELQLTISIHATRRGRDHRNAVPQ